MMRRAILFFAVLALALSCSNRAGDMYTALEESGHPRIFADKAEFDELRTKVQQTDNAVLALFHNSIMDFADKAVSHSVCDPLTTVFSTAYAWRFSGKKSYLQTAERYLNELCDRPERAGDLSPALAIGYDWLYHGLRDSTRTKVRNAIHNHAFDLFGALAVYESFPIEGRAVIDSTVAVLAREPDFAGEGPVLMIPELSRRVALVAALESTLGTDFGLAGTFGLEDAGSFESFMIGNTGQYFGYGDNVSTPVHCLPLWYLADRFRRPELAYPEMELIASGDASAGDFAGAGLLPMYIINAARMDTVAVEPSREHFYVSPSAFYPIVAARTGWAADDFYLGIKGGRASMNHSHMDAGSFVFEAYGVRWACDPSRQPDSILERPCRELGGRIDDMSQQSVRWELFRFNNYQHNTLTVNGRLHNADAFAPMTDSFCEMDESGADGAIVSMGASLDLTALFDDALQYSGRRISVRNASNTGKWSYYLEVKDDLKGGESPCVVRWTLVGEGKPRIEKDGTGITLSARGKTMLLRAEISGSGVGSDSSQGVEYCIWPSSPAECGYLTSHFDDPMDEYVCGFEFTIPAGREITVVTTLERLK